MSSTSRTVADSTMMQTKLQREGKYIYRYIFSVTLLVLIVLLALGCTGSGAGQAPSDEQGQEKQAQQQKGEKGQQQALSTAVEDYYKAVDSKDWDYTYDQLDSRTKQRFTRDEWVQKNQYFADNSPLDRTSPKIVGDLESPPILVTLTQTFKDGTSRSRDTYFVSEENSWKHRFSDEEYNLFMADASFEEFKKAQGQPERAQQQGQKGQGQGEKAQQQNKNSTGGGLSGTYGCLSFSDGYADPSSGVPPSGVPIRFTVRPDGTWTDITFGKAKAVEGEYTVSGGTAQFMDAQGNPLFNFSVLEGGARLLDEYNRQNCRK